MSFGLYSYMTLCHPPTVNQQLAGEDVKITVLKNRATNLKKKNEAGR